MIHTGNDKILDNENIHMVSDKFSFNRILYKDDFLAVFNKLPGEICESWTKESREGKTMYVPEAFCKCIENKNDIPKFCQCFNRLDRPVSGANLLVFNKDLLPLLQNQFTNSQKDVQTVKKTYWAIVEGVLPVMNESELLEHYIRFDSKKQKSYIFTSNERKTKLARLTWRSIGHGENYSFLEVGLLTGRTHQIRAQLSHIGLHIKGDVKYGARRQDTLPGIRLHSRYLQFQHPKTKESLCFTAPIQNIDPLWKAFEDCVQ